MRHILLVVILATSAASAGTARDPAGEFGQIHAACVGLARLARSPHHEVAVSATVSLATCEAAERMRPIVLVDREAAARALESAVAPSVRVLDQVIASGEPRWQIAAFHAEGTLREGMALRLLGTIPKLPHGASLGLQVLHEQREQAVRVRVAPWVDLARADFSQVGRLARLHPELANDQLVAEAVRDSARQPTKVLATR